MTFKDLRKRVISETAIQQQQSRLFDRLQGKPFWIWDKQQHKLKDIKTDGDCCFNHIIGLPQRDGTDKPLYDYEQILYDSLVTSYGNANKKHIWIKKATGLGVSEFMLRFMAWAGSQMCIVMGSRIDLAIALINMMKSSNKLC